MKICTFKEEDIKGKKFLKCQYANCKGMQWLEDAIGLKAGSLSQCKNKHKE